MLRFNVLFLSFCFFQNFAQAYILTERYSCPKTHAGHAIVGMSIFKGDPALKVVLAPDNANQSLAHPTSSHWTFTRDTNQNLQIACRYQGSAGIEDVVSIHAVSPNAMNCATMGENKIRCEISPAIHANDAVHAN